MSEEKEESGLSTIKKTIIGAITTAVTAGGAWFATHLGGGDEPKEEAKTEKSAQPVINVNLENNNTNQQKQSGGGNTTIIREKTVEKAAAPAPAPETKPKQDEEDPW